MNGAAAPEAAFNGGYAGRRVFVTGHTGFKGAWLTLWLRELGADVAGYALAPPTSPNLFDALQLSGDVRDTRGDVCDEGALTRALVAHQPSVVFHLAAQALVRPSYEDPVGTYATNVMGTAHLLEAARRCPSVKAVVVVTSDKCYENPEGRGPHHEGDEMGGSDPYSSSKGCAELVARAYRASFFGPDSGVCLTTVRAGNVIGGGDWGRDRLLPDCARALAAGEAVMVRNPASVRPWQYVLEPLAGYLWLGARSLTDSTLAGPWNFGPPPEEAAPVGDVVERFVNAWGGGAWRRAALEGHAPHESVTLRLDSAKAARDLGWRTVCDLDETVAATARWYRAYYGRAEDMRAYSRGLIAAYRDGAARAGRPWAALSTIGVANA